MRACVQHTTFSVTYSWILRKSYFYLLLNTLVRTHSLSRGGAAAAVVPVFPVTQQSQRCWDGSVPFGPSRLCLHAALLLLRC
jgi:hypothetical protein